MIKINAQNNIDYINSFVEYPEALCKEDWWGVWRPLIARSCAVVNDEFRIKGIEAISFFNQYFA